MGSWMFEVEVGGDGACVGSGSLDPGGIEEEEMRK